jgi:uncharacterized membrane protein
MIHGVLTITFTLLLLLVGLPIAMIVATKHEDKYKEFFGHNLFIPACLLSGSLLYGLAQILSPAFYVLMVIPGLGLFVLAALMRAGKL